MSHSSKQFLEINGENFWYDVHEFEQAEKHRRELENLIWRDTLLFKKRGPTKEELIMRFIKDANSPHPAI